MIAAEFSHVSKQYANTTALHDLSLQVPAGSVFGLVGPNGAGKTTAIKILLGLTRATGGTTTLFGGNSTKRVSYLPDVPGQYEWMTAPEYLAFIGGINSVPVAVQNARIVALLEMAGLADVRTAIGGYSRGMKQRLGIAQALVSAPDLLILDEPTSALDPLGRHEFMQRMLALRGHTTIIFSSHILTDVELVADQFAILHRGQLVANGTLAEIQEAASLKPHLEVDILGDAAAFANTVSVQPWSRSCSVIGQTVQIESSDPTAAMRSIPKIAAQHGLGISKLADVAPTLEQSFLALTGERS